MAEHAMLNSGDTAFMIMCTCFVLLMTLPGLMLFYGGLSGFKSVISTSLQTLAVACLISITWLMLGYSLAFGNGSDGRFIGGAEKFWYMGDAKTSTDDDGKQRVWPESMVGTIPESVFLMFQLAFAIITACIAAGSFAERMKLHSMLIFFFLWHCLVYCPVAHMNWHPNGILRRWGVLDFAGGNVVHILSGVTGAVGSVILGPRKLDETLRSDHTTLLTFIGGSLLFIGWFGFNAGSAFTAGTSAGWALMTTHICATTCAFTWMLVEWKRSGQPTLIGIVSGAITGLVLITPGAGFVDQTGAFVIGLVGAPICYALVVAKNYAGIDEKPARSDYPDAFGVHAIGGIIGGGLVGLFARVEIAGVPHSDFDGGAFYYNKNGHQLGWQIVGILVSGGYALVATAIIMLALKFTIGINIEDVTPEPDAAGSKSADPEAPVEPTEPVPSSQHALSPMMGVA